MDNFSDWGCSVSHHTLGGSVHSRMVAGDDLHYKILDGLDGLATGVTSIGALILFVLSLLPEVGQPETALMAWVLFSACLAFFVF